MEALIKSRRQTVNAAVPTHVRAFVARHFETPLLILRGSSRPKKMGMTDGLET